MPPPLPTPDRQDNALPQRARPPAAPPGPRPEVFTFRGNRYRVEPWPEIVNVRIVLPVGSTAEQSAAFEPADHLLIRHVTCAREDGGTLGSFRLGWRDSNDVVAEFLKPSANASQVYPLASTIVTDASANPLRRVDTVFIQGQSRTFYAQSLAAPAAETAVCVVLHTFRLRYIGKA